MQYIAKASVAIVMASLMFVIVFAPAPVVAADAPTNPITVEIVGWSADRCDDRCNVQFRISMDLDNDGTFELVNESQVFDDVAHVSEPLRANISVPSDQATFLFKVEAFSVNNGSLAPLYYGRNESAIVHQGANIPGFDSSWEYNYPRNQPVNGSTCSLSYRYEVAGLGSNGTGGPTADVTGPAGGSSPSSDLMLLLAVGLLSAVGGAGAMKLANGRSDTANSNPQNDQDGPDAPDDPDSPTCPTCNNEVLKEGDFCHHCGSRKPAE